MFRKTITAIIAILLAGAFTLVLTACDNDNGNGGDTATVPGKVTGFTATGGNGQVKLDWAAPSNNGGSAITGYEVTMDDWANKVEKEATELTHAYTGLINDTEYTFKVRAVNAKGAGAEETAAATPEEVDTPCDCGDDDCDPDNCECPDCGTSGGQCECNGEHDFSGDWLYNATQHYKECECEYCEATGEYEDHTFENSVCTECGYNQTLFTLTVTRNITAGGTVSPTIRSNITAGESISIRAYPAAGYKLVRWELTSAAGTATIFNIYSEWPDVTVYADATIRAIFEIKTVSLTIEAYPQHMYGMVTVPDVLNGPITTTHTITVPALTPISINALTGWTFVRWVEAGNRPIGWKSAATFGNVYHANTTVTLTDDVYIKAVFRSPSMDYGGELTYIYLMNDMWGASPIKLNMLIMNGNDYVEWRATPYHDFYFLSGSSRREHLGNDFGSRIKNGDYVRIHVDVQDGADKADSRYFLYIEDDGWTYKYRITGATPFPPTLHREGWQLGGW